ncbi:MAG: transglutaminase-like domain-containing protein [Phycisphaerales bacterium]|nr:transglutaminase-like domain-containing protein [Phycisphaerales bacterium]
MNPWTDRYIEALESLHRHADLVNATLAIAGHRRPTIDPAQVEAHLEAIAHRIRTRVPHLAGRHGSSGERGISGLLAHLHEALFDDLGLGGDGEVGLHPDASDIALVLETGRGLPIACSLIYCATAERIGLEAYGIDAPGHFLVGVPDGDSTLIVDPFGCGRLLSQVEFANLVHAYDEDTNPEEILRPAPPAAWLERWLRNLVVACGRCGETHQVSNWTRLVEETARVLGTS